MEFIYIEKAEESPIELLPSICSECAFINPNNPTKCTAFPGGIPLEVFTGEFDHHQAYPGDGGITFEPMSVTKADVSHVPRDDHGRWTKVGGRLGSNFSRFTSK